jgi:hypothetical protein
MGEIYTVRVGCADLPPRTAPERYFAKLDFLESTLIARAVVGDKVLRRWRILVPEGGLALVAPADLDATLARTAEAVKLTSAAALVIRTGPELSPSSSGRDRVRRLFAEQISAARFPGIARVWVPDGLWELPALAGFARELDATIAFDPLTLDPGVDVTPAVERLLDRGAPYLRLTGLGRRQGRHAPHDLEALAAVATAVDRATVVFATPDSYREARAFRALVEPDD